MEIQVDRLLSATITAGASDLHLNVGQKPLVNKAGVLTPLETDIVLTEAHLVTLVKSLVTEENSRVHLDTNKSLDFAFPFTPDKTKPTTRFRGCIVRERGRFKITLRRLPHKILSPEEIGFPRVVLDLARRARGLLLVTGPTGSGKTTTLASLVKFLSRQSPGRHIYTIEEPNEYIHSHGTGVVTQREVPTDAPSFMEGLNDALRSAPNVIVVGEMRGLETMRTAITAAETGHLVMATLHTSSAATTINRVIDSFPETEKDQVRAQLSVSLLGVLCQQLVPRSDKPGSQVAAFELLVVTPAIQNLIRKEETNRIPDEIQTGAKLGMKLLDAHLYDLCSQGIISKDDAFAKANDGHALAKRLVHNNPGTKE